MTNWNPADIITFWLLIAAGVTFLVALFGGRK
jgi:hypothetical protein